MTLLKITLAATAAIGLTLALVTPTVAQSNPGGAGPGGPAGGHNGGGPRRSGGPGSGYGSRGTAAGPSGRHQGGVPAGGYAGRGYRGGGYHGSGYRGGAYWGGYSYYGWPGYYGYYGWPGYYGYDDDYDVYSPPSVYYPEAPPPPEPPPPVAVAPKSFVIYFPFDSAELTPQASQVIADAARYDAGSPDARVTIVGHTDAAGSDDYNQALSARRSQAVREALLTNGVPDDTVDMDWKGERDQAVETPDGAREAANRRVTVVIWMASERN